MDKAREEKRRFTKETEEYDKKLKLFLQNPHWATRKNELKPSIPSPSSPTPSVASPPQSPAIQNKRVR